MMIDVDALRSDLMNYYGTAMTGPFPMAATDVSRVENASPMELVEMAQDLGFDLTDYAV